MSNIKFDISAAKGLVMDLNNYINSVQREKASMVSNTNGTSWSDDKFVELCQSLDQIFADMKAAQKVELECRDFLKKKIEIFERS